MATLNKGASGKGNSGHQHDGQKNFQNSNQQNPDHVRDNTRDHRYKEHDETLTNQQFAWNWMTKIKTLTHNFFLI
jgi:hypothetical protein